MTVWRPTDRPTDHVSMQNLNMDNFSDTIGTTLMKLGQKVVCDKSFLDMQVKMTLTQRPRSQETWKITKKKVKMFNFSTTFQTAVMKLGQLVGS